MKDNKRVNLQILDKEYHVACPLEERDALLTAAEELDARMRNVRNSGSVIGAERVAVMVALNLCYELQQSKKNISTSPSTDKALKTLIEKLDSTLQIHD